MNQLKVNQQQSIIALHQQGWSRRRIARELGLDRGTVAKYLAQEPKPATNPQTGSERASPPKPASNPQTGSGSVPGPASLCEPWREQIEAALKQGLSIQRIYQDLVAERQFTGSYHAVRRFVLRRVDTQELPFRRMECAPGQELQVDFGLGGWVMKEGKRRRPDLFRAVLSHSRKGLTKCRAFCKEAAGQGTLKQKNSGLKIRFCCGRSHAIFARMANNTLLQLDLPGIKKLKSGKVREIFDLGDSLLFVATDRISAFDCIMPNGIPRKGEVLTQISYFWFQQTQQFQPNHLISHPGDALPPNLRPFAEQLSRRSMIVKKAKPLAIECVVRGYLAGSGWKEYRQSQTVCGIKLPGGLKESSELPEPIFTPATKAETGHDENISFEQAAEIVGRDIATRARDASLKIYNHARDYARQRGIIIADTKFEFGLLNGDLLLIDEVLTPDSSRFWPADQYQPGKSQPSFDKQFVRDYLETLDWNKTPPAPALPSDVVDRTQAKYLEAYERLTGKKL